MARWLPDASLGSAFDQLRNGIDGQEAQGNFLFAEGANCKRKRVPNCPVWSWVETLPCWLAGSALLPTPRGAPPAEGAFGAASPPLQDETSISGPWWSPAVLCHHRRA